MTASDWVTIITAVTTAVVTIITLLFKLKGIHTDVKEISENTK